MTNYTLPEATLLTFLLSLPEWHRADETRKKTKKTKKRAKEYAEGEQHPTEGRTDVVGN